MILIMRALARAADNQEECCQGYICGNCEQGTLNLNNITLIREDYLAGSCASTWKTPNGVLITTSVTEDELFMTAAVLLLCIPAQ